MLGDSHRNLLASGTSSHKKHLDKFFKIFHTSFWRLALATCSRLIPVMKNVCSAQWRLFSGQFSKTFQFSLAFCDCSLSCPFLSLTNSPCLLQNPPFSSASLHQYSRTRFGFSYFLKDFHVSSLWFLGLCVLLSIEKYVVRIWFGYSLLSLLIGICLFSTYYAFNTWFHVCFSFFSSLSCLCCVVHIMLIVKCFIDTFLCLWELHRLRCTTYAHLLHQCCSCLPTCHNFAFQSG